MFWKDNSKESSRAFIKKKMHFPFDFDRWYPTLQPLTFPSEILEVTVPEAQAMMHYYQAHYLMKDVFTAKDHTILASLKTKIDTLITSHFPNGVFVRMSNRSPKDGLPLLSGTQSLSDQIDSIRSSLNSNNDKLIIINQLQMDVLKCKDASQVLHLILSSERIYFDLCLALDNHTLLKNDIWSSNIILRAWQSDFRQ